MLTSGQIIKQIREKRGYSAFDTYDGIITKTNYYRFEAGKSDTSSESFLQILTRLGVDLAEFGSIYRQEYIKEADVNMVYAHYPQAKTQKDYRTLNYLGDIMNRAFEQTKSKLFQHNAMIFKIWADGYEHGKLTTTKAELQFLLDYVKKAETWYRYDITLYTDIMDYLDWDDLVTTLPYVVQRSFFPRVLTDNLAISQPNIVLHALETTIRNKNYEHFKLLIPVLEMTKPSEEELDAYFALQVFAIFDKLVESNNSEDQKKYKKQLDQFLASLNFIGATKIYYRLKDDLYDLWPLATHSNKMYEY